MYFAHKVFKVSHHNLLYVDSDWLAGIWNAQCIVCPVILYAAFPVGATSRVIKLLVCCPGFFVEKSI